MRPFAELVDEHRRRRRLTQAALARRVGVTQPTLAEWLSGRRPVPAMRLQRLVEALDLCGTARDELLVAVWIAAVPPPVAHLLLGLMRSAGRRRVGILVRQALRTANVTARSPQPPDPGLG